MDCRMVACAAVTAAALSVSACEGEQHAFLRYASAHFDRPQGDVRDGIAPLAVGADVEFSLHPPPYDGGKVRLVSVKTTDPSVATAAIVDDTTVRLTAVGEGAAELVVEHSAGEEIATDLSVHEPAAALVTPVNVAIVPRELWENDPVVVDGAGLAVGLRHLDDRGRRLVGPWRAWRLEGRTDAVLESPPGDITATVFGGKLPYRVFGGNADALGVGTASVEDVVGMDVFVEGHGLRSDGDRLDLSIADTVKIVALPRTADGRTVIAHGYIPQTTVDDDSEFYAEVHGARLCPDHQLGCVDTTIRLTVRSATHESVGIELLGQTVHLDVTVE